MKTILRPLNVLLYVGYVSTLFFILLTSCSKSGDVSLTNHNFEDEIEQTQNLVFTFNRDLVPESELNTWVSTDFIEFSPKVNGKFKWTAPNELVFSPAVGFEPATEYSATITKQVLDRAKEKYGLDVDKLSFHTPYLKLQNTETYWAKSREDGQAVAMVKLDFNYPVNPQEVAKTLSIKDDDGKAYTYQIVQTGVSETVTAKVKDLANTEGKSLQITLEKGLSVPNSTYTTEEVLEASVALPDISTLEILNVEHGFDNNQGYIRVTFNQAIQGENVKDIYSVTSNASDTEVEEEEVVVELDTLGNPIPQAEKPAKKVAPSLETKAELIENGLLIKGDFNETDNYVLTINTKAKGVLGAALSDDYTKDIYFGDMPASVAFVNKKAVYLSSKGNRNVAVNIVNIPKVNVKISKIYENNILNFLRQNRYQDYGYEEGEEGMSSAKVFDYYDDESGLYSDVIVNKTVETGNLPKSKGISALNLSLPTQNDIKGIYLVTLNSADEYYKNATKLVSISDIGLITKQSDDEIIILANSIKTAEPMGDVEISLISSNNQTIAKAKTSGDGTVTFKDFKKKGFTVAMIVAHTEDDFNYLLYEDTAVETSRFEVDGKRNNSSGFEAFIYGDRDIYRPGEPIHFNTLIRKQDWESVGEIPVKIRILLPNGKEYKTFREQTNNQGAVAMTVPTDRASVTGTYVIEVLNGNDVLLASRNVAIEEFMPDRIKVDVKASKEFYRNGESVQIAATALNLFGPPASNRNYEMEFRLARKAFLPKGYSNYTFDIQDNTTFESITRQGVTNQQGVAAESFQVPVTYSDMGVLEAKNYVTVFDETGRPVNRLKRLDIFTQAIFYGIGMPDTYIGTNAPTQIPLVALNKDGKPVAGKGKVEIVRFDYQTVIQRNPDKSLNYSSKKQTKVVYSRTVNFVNGQASVNYAPPISGEYEVRVHREGAKSWTAQSFYAYGWGNTENSSFEVNNEGQVTMEFDKEKYEVGDKAKVLFKTPFAGKLIVTIERNHVLEYHILETDKKSAELSFSLGKEHLPNVYVSATLIRPMDESNLPLTVAHGYAPVMVEDTDNQLPIEIVAVERSRSKTKQHITIKTKANTELTIAVVDEGILQLKNFKTPDPYAYFYQKQALEVNSYDLYPFLFPEFSIRGSSSTGGDGYDLEKRVNPLTNSRVNLVAIWSGIVKTGLGGTTEFSFDIPQFSGDLRIMAVAYKDHAFGSATKNMKVADPLVISTALPRFASPNDEIQVPVNISNTTKQNASVTATITTTGSVGMVGVRQQKLVIPAEQEGRAYFAVRALPNTGNGSVTISVNGLKETFTERVELGVRAASSLIKTASSGAVNAGQVANVSIGLPDFIPSSVKSQLVVSKSPITQFIDKFDNLLGYPHGCVEQTVSKAFPQLYFKDFVALMQKGKKPYMKSGENELNPVANVNAAIHKLETMQLSNGALAYWQGSDTESWWGTAYACHFMIEAQKADYEVNATNLGRLLEYLNNRANKRETSNDSYYDENNNRITRVIASREGIYGLYVLALAGKANRSVMNYYKSNEQLLTQDERYLLAAAYSLVGDGKSYTALLPKNYINTRYDRETDYSFSSPIRDQALVLNTLIDSDPNNLQIPSLARQLSQAVKMQPWLNTQEEAFAFLSLGKLAKKAASSSVTGSVSSAGVVTNFTGADLTLTKVGNPSIVRASGRGTLYYFAQSEGLSVSGKVQELDNTLKVRRSYFSRTGQAIGTAKFKQNDLIVVKVTLSSSLPVHNIVVTDMLPAGFEIENPRLTADREMTWIKDQTTPEHFDIRDDRINFFTSIDSGSKTFYYLVRAVSKGKYVRGPVSADAMYNGDYRSYNGSGVVTIE